MVLRDFDQPTTAIQFPNVFTAHFPALRRFTLPLALAIAATCLSALAIPSRLTAQSNQGPKPVGPNPQPDPALNVGATLYAYGTAAGDAAAAKSDDAFTLYSLANAGPLGSPLSFPFFQTLANQVYVNNNGLLSLNGAVSAYSGQPFPYSSNPVIAPFWADVDTRGTNAGTVWYRTAQDAPTLNAIGAQIESSFAGVQNFTPTFASIATWDHVGYYPNMSNYVNRFQAVVASDGVRTYALFLYPNQAIWWLRGTSSTSDPGMGYDAGNNTNFLNTTYSRTASMYDVWFSSNTEDNSPGVYAFRLDDGSRETRIISTDLSLTERKLYASYALRLSDLPSSGTQVHRISDAAFSAFQFNQLTFDDPTETLASTNSLMIAKATDAVNHGTVVIGGTARFLAAATGSLNGGTFTLQRAGTLHVWVPNALTANADLTFDNASDGASGSGGTVDLRGNSTTVGALISLGTNAGIITSSLAGGSTLDLAGANSGNFNGRLENGLGVLSLVKSGPGTQTLSGTNTYTGSTTLRGGTLAVSADVNLGATTAPVIFAGGTLRATASFNTARETTLATGGGSIEVASGANLTWQSGITGAVGNPLTKTGSGSLTLSGLNLYYGTTQINAGTLVVGATGTIPDYSPVVVAEGATLDLANRQDTVGSISGAGQIVLGTGTLASGGDNTSTNFGGVISGDGNFVKVGSGWLAFTAANTYTGTTTVNAGVLVVATGGSIHSPAAAISVGNFDHGWLKVDQGVVTTSAVVLGHDGGTGTLTLNGGTLNTATIERWSGGSTATFDGATVRAASDAPLLINGFTYNSAIINAGGLTIDTNSHTAAFSANTMLSGTGGLTKTGAGTLTLNAAHAYSGTTNISAGTLALGATGSLANSSAIRVDSGATFDVSAVGGGFVLASGQTLSGTGTIAGPATLASGAILSPGNSPGTLSVTGNITWTGGASYLWEINDASSPATGAGTRYDLLSISGTLSLTATAENKFTLSLVSLLANNAAGNVINFNSALDSSYTLATTTGGIIGFDANAFTINAAGFTNALNGGTWSLALANANKDLALNFTAAAIPEPSTYAALFGAGALALALYRKHRAPRVTLTTRG